MTYTKHCTLFLVTLLLSAVYANDGFVTVKGAALTQESIPETHVADLISHMSGSFMRSDVDRAGFPQVDLFSLPKANVFVVLDAVSEDLIENMENREFFEIDNTVPITKDAYPEDSLSSVTSMVTGEDYHGHGIIGHSWQATDFLAVKAFQHNGQRKVPNLVDLFTYNSQGAARTLVVAGNQKMAFALGAHNELFSTHPDWNNQALYYSPSKGITSLYTDDVLADISTIRSASQKRMMKVETREGFVLAAELYAIENLPKVLAKMPASTSSVPDFIAVGITSIRTLTVKFGRDSEQVRVAMGLLDSALANMYLELNQMYDSQVTAEIVGLGSSTAEHTAKTQDAQIKKARGVLYDYYYYYEYTAEDVSSFQTSLWTALTFIVAVIIGIIWILKMDKLYDSILYKTTDGPRPIQNVK